jgi:hypothetical protein
MGVFLCIGKHIHEMSPSESLPYTHFNNFQQIHEHYNEHGFVFVFLAKAFHKIKKKAEQAACFDAIQILS